MSATYRCDLCKDPDLDATHTFYPNFPVRRYVPGGIEYYNEPNIYVGGQIAQVASQSYDLCEACRIQYTELIDTFLGRK